MKSRARLRAHRAVAGLSVLGLFLASSLLAEKPDVRARLVVPESAPAGSRVKVVVEMTIGPGWHVNSHTPAEKFLVPTDVSVATTAGTVSPIQYPPHVERRFAFSEQALRVYEGTVRFEAEVALAGGAAERASITGVVSYQACSDRQCFPPSKIPLEANLSLASGR